MADRGFSLYRCCYGARTAVCARATALVCESLQIPPSQTRRRWRKSFSPMCHGHDGHRYLHIGNTRDERHLSSGITPFAPQLHLFNESTTVVIAGVLLPTFQEIGRAHIREPGPSWCTRSHIMHEALCRTRHCGATVASRYRRAEVPNVILSIG